MSTSVPTLPVSEWEVWSTRARVVVDGTAAELVVAEDATRAVLRAMDAAASRFRDDSDLSRVNAADGEPTLVSALLLATLGHALLAARRTGGAVDPTLGEHLVALGYATDFGLSAGFRAADVQPPARAGRWCDVVLDHAARTVTLPPGVALDLGATAKAHAADLAAAIAHQRTGVHVLVSLGGDLAASGPPAGEHGWSVRVAETPEGSGPHVVLESGGLATSTTLVRRWQSDGRTFHHLIDPRTGRPAEGRWRTATVAADTCVAANTASTAVVVLGERAVDWLERHGLPARLVGTDGALVTTCGWPRDGEVA